MYEFRVVVSLEADEKIVVVGDCPELGDWDPEFGLELDILDQERGLFGAEKEIDSAEIAYRYVILSKNPKLPGLPSLIEGANIKWRIQQVECHDDPRHKNAGSETSLDHFGTIDGVFRADHGWITKDSVIQLKFFNDAVMIWNESFAGKKARIRLSSFFHKGSSVKSASAVGLDLLHGYRNGPQLWFSDLNDVNSLAFHAQPETGVPIGESMDNFCLTFQTSLAEGLSKIGFLIEVLFDPNPDNCPDVYMGEAYKNDEQPSRRSCSCSPAPGGKRSPDVSERGFSLLLPSLLSKSSGVLTVPLCTLDHDLVGEVRVEHIVITPTQRNSHHFLSRMYSKNWKKSWVGLEIGHRGLGQSFAANEQCRATIRENTFHSFMEAGRNGADMIELDVHLTADKIPVIYHDFQAPVKLASRRQTSTGRTSNGTGSSRGNGGDGGVVVDTGGKSAAMMNAYEMIGKESQFMLAIRDRTFTELQDLVINNESDWERKLRESGCNEDDPLIDPFPALKAVLETLDPSIGINVELKYPNHLTSDSREFDRPFDMNEYVDTIVRTLEESPMERLIVLSCFNPDVCHALKLKQTSFPVLFLTQGVTSKWPSYMDPRTRSTDNAIRFAKATELMGVSCHAEEVLKDLSIIRRCQDEKLVMFIWGEDNSQRGVIRKFKDLGVHGIIVDRLDELTEKVEKSSVLKRGSAGL